MHAYRKDTYISINSKNLVLIEISLDPPGELPPKWPRHLFLPAGQGRDASKTWAMVEYLKVAEFYGPAKIAVKWQIPKLWMSKFCLVQTDRPKLSDSFYIFSVTHPTFQVQLIEIFPQFEDKNQPTSKGEPPGFINPLGFEDLLKPPNWAALAMLARSEKKWSNLRLNPPDEQKGHGGTRVGWTPVRSRYYHLTSKVWVYHLWQKEVWTETYLLGARHSCTQKGIGCWDISMFLGENSGIPTIQQHAP